MHKRYHTKSVGGIDLPTIPARVIWEEGNDFVSIIDRHSTLAERKKAREILAVVDEELSASEISDAILWHANENYKLYVFAVHDQRKGSGRKAIGCLLAERIQKAYQVQSCADKESSSLTLGVEQNDALLGIARIWTCAEYRRRGVAMRLLDLSKKTFIYGMTLETRRVAFSQPTESGGKLARAWVQHQNDYGNMQIAEDLDNKLAVYLERHK